METNVAIIIANYNYGHYLMDGIESIRKQTYTGSSSATGASGYGQLQVTP